MREVITTVGILLLVLIASAVLFLPKRGPRETFAESAAGGQPSTRNLFRTLKSGNEFDKSVSELYNGLSDRDDLIHVHRCYQMPPHAARTLFTNLGRNNVLTSQIRVMASSFTHIRERIVDRILNLKQRLRANIQGPVYAFITQAPQYVDDQGRPMTVQYHINEYIFKPYNIITQRDGPGALMVTVTLVLPSYGIVVRNRKRRIVALKRPVPLDSIRVYGKPLKSLESRDNKCMIECINESQSFCGCSTQQGPHYKATCLGPTSKKHQEAPSTFVMLYKINPHYGKFIEEKVFGDVSL